MLTVMNFNVAQIIAAFINQYNVSAKDAVKFNAAVMTLKQQSSTTSCRQSYLAAN